MSCDLEKICDLTWKSIAVFKLIYYCYLLSVINSMMLYNSFQQICWSIVSNYVRYFIKLIKIKGYHALTKKNLQIGPKVYENF